MKKKRLPLGVSDFKTLINDNYYFVDKSMLIDELLDKKSKVTLLLRPRRFGKTLSMSMIDNFFNIEKKEENKDLFNGLAISKTDKMEYMGESPVVFLSFKDIKVDNWEFCLEKLLSLIEKEYKKYGLSLEENRDAQENSLLNLSKYIYEKYGKKVIILIDEYDTPLISAHYNGYYKEAIGFFINFFSAALKGNPYLEFSVLTGILKINMANSYSGFNNLVCYTVLDESYNQFGLKEEEVEEMLEYYERLSEQNEIKKWFFGYSVGKERVYNPCSIISYLSQKNTSPYWCEQTFLKELLEKNDVEVLEELEQLFKGETIWKNISENIVFDDMNQMNTIWSLMLFSGYLTFESIRTSSITHMTTYSLKIPNEEIKSFFRESFINEYAGGKYNRYSLMMEELFLGKIESFSQKFKSLYLSSVSYYDMADSEKYYHHFMLGFFLTLGDRYIITSNRESGYGRYDIALEPKDKKNFGMIFEFKIATDETLIEKSKLALAQINKKRYDVSMKTNGVSKVIKIGMAFSKKDVAIESVID